MTLRVGLVGAGPWARMVHGPGLAAADGIELAGVWARRAEAAGELAGSLGTEPVGDVDELIERVDAVAFAVEPAVQGRLAVRAAAAGRHLILDKPIAADLPTAEYLAATVARNDLRSAVFFTARYTGVARAFLAEAAARDDWQGARGAWVSPAALHGEFSRSPWRQERGALWDVGPHAVDLLMAALGPVADVQTAHRSDDDFVTLTLVHPQRIRSQLALSLRVPSDDATEVGAAIELYGSSGRLRLGSGETAEQAYAVLLTEFTGAVAGSGAPVTCDVARGLEVQRVLDRAQSVIDGHSMSGDVSTVVER